MYIAAFDIGGTKTISAILDGDGKILVQETFPSITADWKKNMQKCVDIMKCQMAELKVQATDMEGLGISLPGPVDTDNGVLIYAPYAKWEYIPVAEYFRSQLGFETICCENDVNACAVGELRFGLGKKYRDFIWMTVSTGVGGAVVADGKLIRGGKGYAGEFGHLKVEYEHPEVCSCGQLGCLEAHGSGTALIRETRRAAEADPEFAKALVEAGKKADGAGCAALCKAGNETAQRIMHKLGVYLGRGISYCVNVLNPEAVIVGGGVAASLDLLMPAIRETLQTDAYVKMKDTEVVQTPLGYDAALRGAAALVLEYGKR